MTLEDFDNKFEEIENNMVEITEKLEILSNEMKNSLDKINSNSKNIKKNTSALEILHEVKETSIVSANRIFAIWLATFIAFLGLLGYTIYLLNSYQAVTTTQEVEQQNDNGNNNFIGRDGDINGNTKDKDNNN